MRPLDLTKLASRATLVALAAASLGLVALSCAPARAQDYNAIVAAPDRSEADRQTDQKREPVKFLTFTGVKTGMKVLDMGASGGYTTELLARAVGPTGKVYAQDSEDVIARFVKDKFDQRAKSPAMANVVHVVRPYDDPVPPEARDLDLVTFFFWYHDTSYMKVDRAAMDRKLYEALKPGGFLVLADHSAKPGTGTSVANTLHRIDEATVRQELEAAGFKLVDQADFLRNKDDPRDTLIFRSKVPVDAFILKFQKPS